MPRTAREYLNDWVSPERAWLRRYFADGDEPLVDMTAEAEQAITWVTQLTDRSFVGTESRLRNLLDLLDDLARALETDADRRVADLERRRPRSTPRSSRSTAAGSSRLTTGSSRSGSSSSSGWPGRSRPKPLLSTGSRT